MLVSVLVNNYNYGEYIKECIDSLISQSYKNLEIIVYDDGSTDNSLEILKKYGNKISVIAKKNYGKYPAFNQMNAVNQAYSISKGEIVFLLDSDDIFYNNKVERIVSLFKNNDNLVMIEHEGKKVDKKLTEIGTVKKSYNGLLIDAIRNKRHYCHHMPTSFLAFRRSFLSMVLPMKEDKYYLAWIDSRLSNIANFYGEVMFLEEALISYRIHGNNYGACKIDNKKAFRTFIHRNQFVNNYLKEDPYFKPLCFYLSKDFLIHFLNFISPKIMKFLLKLKNFKFGMRSNEK